MRPILDLPPVQLPEPMVRDLRRMNPWWQDGQAPPLPSTRRHLVAQIHRRLDMRLAPAVVVRGPRQIGKTTAQLQVVEDLLKRGVPPRNIFRVQTDELAALEEVAEPILRLADWYEETILGETLNAMARRGEPTYLVFDEIQNLDNWAPQLKSLVDHSATRVLVTGSSALHIERGRDSLAGRITTIEAGVLSLTEIAAFRGLELGSPFLADNGLQPLIQQSFWEELREHGRAFAAARDQAFRWFSERGGYPLSKINSSRQKLTPLDPEALARNPDLSPSAQDRAESVLDATLATIPLLDVSRFPRFAKRAEMDRILIIGTRRIPVEVKYQKRIDPLRDTEALRTFLEKAANNAPFGLLVTQTDVEAVVDPRIVALPLSTVMLLR
jgi:hypothetical protein